MSLSSLVLTNESEESQTARHETASAESLSPAVTHGVRLYKQGDALDFHMVIYPGAGKNPKIDDLSMQVEIVRSEQTVYQSQWESLESRIVARDNKGIEIGGRLAVTLKPGVYELRIAVQNRGAKRAEQRVVLFGEEP